MSKNRKCNINLTFVYKPNIRNFIKEKGKIIH